ncbi:MAG: histidine kinase [Bacteroidota bacterium]
MTSIVFVSPLLGQSLEDSLLSVAHAIPDQQQRWAYLDSLCTDYFQSDKPHAEKLMRARLDLVKEIGDMDTEISRVVQTSDYFLFQQLTPQAEALLQPYLDSIDRIQPDSNKLSILKNRANLYAKNQKFEKAVELYTLIIEKGNSSADTSLRNNARDQVDLGINYGHMGLHGESSVAFNKAKALYLQQKDTLGLMDVYIQLGILFSQIGLYGEAEAYINERQKYPAYYTPLSQAYDNVNLARNQIIEQEYGKALVRYHKARSMGPFPKEYKFVNVFILNGIIESHYFLGEADSVRKYFRDFERLMAGWNDASYYQFLFDQSQFLFYTTEGNYARAEVIMNGLYQRALDNKDRAELLMYNQFNADMYKKSGNYAKALRFSELYGQGLDSTQTANKAHALLLYQTQYETREKEKTIENLRIEQRLQAIQSRVNRNRFIFGIVAIIILAILGLVILYFRNRFQRAAQVASLRNKISSDLHDDVGTLLTGLAMQSELLELTSQSSDKAALGRINEMSRSAMSRMRDAVWAMDAQKDNWHSLLDRMNEFGLETLAARNIEMHIQSEGFQGEENVEGNFRQHVYLIFKEAITNIAKHSNASKVDIQLQKTSDRLVMSIHDNGEQKEKAYKTTGQGTKNMQKRAEILGGTLKTEYKQGFLVQLAVPNA